MSRLDRWSSRVALVAAGVLALASIFAPWRSRGVASALAGRELADLLLAGSLSALVPRWVGAALYLIPMAGAALLIGTGLGGRSGHLTVIAATALLAALDLAMSAALEWGPLRSPGVGALLLHASVLLSVGAVSLAALGGVLANRRLGSLRRRSIPSALPLGADDTS